MPYLRNDHVGAQLLQDAGVYAVDRQALLHDGLDALVNLVAGPVGWNLRLGANGKARDGLGKIALMRAHAATMSL